MIKEIIKTDNYLLAVDDKQINVGNWFYDDARQVRKAVMTYDLHWAMRNEYKCILAHLPLNDAPILEGVPLLPPSPRHQEDGDNPTHFDFEIGFKYYEDDSFDTEILKVDNKHGQTVVCGKYI